jgi:hypothetical protein
MICVKFNLFFSDWVIKALKKLEESLESEATKKSKSGDKAPNASKRKRTINT